MSKLPHWKEKAYYDVLPEEEPKRRVVEGAATSVQKAIEARRERLAAPPEVKPKYKPMTSEAQLERGIYLTNLALNKYQVKLEDGEELDPTEESRFMSLLDTVRKQEATLSAIRSKKKQEDMSPTEIALELLETGMDEDEVLNLYSDNKKVQDAIRKRKR
jgi:hypothetical protein